MSLGPVTFEDFTRLVTGALKKHKDRLEIFACSPHVYGALVHATATAPWCAYVEWHAAPAEWRVTLTDPHTTMRSVGSMLALALSQIPALALD